MAAKTVVTALRCDNRPYWPSLYVLSATCDPSTNVIGDWTFRRDILGCTVGHYVVSLLLPL